MSSIAHHRWPLLNLPDECTSGVAVWPSNLLELDRETVHNLRHCRVVVLKGSSHDPPVRALNHERI